MTVLSEGLEPSTLRLENVCSDPLSYESASRITGLQERAAVASTHMPYKVVLTYFRPTGKYLTHAETTVALDAIVEIWEEVDEMRRLGRLPGLRPGAGRDLLVVVDVPDHPQRVPHLVMPPFVDEDDVTPPRISTGELVPLVRVPLAEMPRTTTRDVVKVDQEDTVVSDEEITPVDAPIPRPPSEKK
jgi:hypothetical protein